MLVFANLLQAAAFVFIAASHLAMFYQYGQSLKALSQ